MNLSHHHSRSWGRSTPRDQPHPLIPSSASSGRKQRSGAKERRGGKRRRTKGSGRSGEAAVHPEAEGKVLRRKGDVINMTAGTGTWRRTTPPTNGRAARLRLQARRPMPGTDSHITTTTTTTITNTAATISTRTADATNSSSSTASRLADNNSSDERNITADRVSSITDARNGDRGTACGISSPRYAES